MTIAARLKPLLTLALDPVIGLVEMALSDPKRARQLATALAAIHRGRGIDEVEKGIEAAKPAMKRLIDLAPIPDTVRLLRAAAKLGDHRAAKKATQ